MIAVLERKPDDLPRDASAKQYVIRLEANRELRLFLMPLVDALLPGILATHPISADVEIRFVLTPFAPASAAFAVLANHPRGTIAGR